jgi:hypothetical protein
MSSPSQRYLSQQDFDLGGTLKLPKTPGLESIIDFNEKAPDSNIVSNVLNPIAISIHEN